MDTNGIQEKECVREIPVRDAVDEIVANIVALLGTSLIWSDISPLIAKEAKQLTELCH